MESQNWTRGSSLVVKPDVTDPIIGRDLSGRQGRLVVLSQEKDVLTLQWDSVTLKSLSPEEIRQCEAIGLPWSAVRLAVQDVLPASARDQEEDVVATLADLERQYSWLSLGERGQRIRAVVYREEHPDFFSSLRVWHAYLEEHLVMPFVAEVIEYQRGPVKQGSQVTVIGISLLDEAYGTIVKVRQQRRVSHLPLRHIRATNDAPAAIAQLIEDYAVWLGYYSVIYARSS